MTSELTSNISRIENGLVCITLNNRDDLTKFHVYLTLLGLTYVGNSIVPGKSVYHTIISWKDKQFLVNSLTLHSYGMLMEEFEDALVVITKPIWKVQIFGNAGASSWEISVVRSDNDHGMKSWGWFDGRKLLVSHNGGPCRWPIIQFVWDEQIKIAKSLCDKLNSGEIAQPIEKN